jgi:hypothetical protein
MSYGLRVWPYEVFGRVDFGLSGLTHSERDRVLLRVAYSKDQNGLWKTVLKLSYGAVLPTIVMASKGL